MSRRAGDRLGAVGYGCLALLVLAGTGGGLFLLFLGVRAVMRGREADLGSSADAAALVDSLEGGVAAAGFGALALLVAAVALVVLLKELADETAARRRGPL